LAGTKVSTIRLTTQVPGPRSTALLERRKQSVLAGVATLHPLFVDRAFGATITDVDGNTFIDFAGGIGVMNVGHSDPAVTQALIQQAARFTHVAFQVIGYEPYVEVAETLARLTPGIFEKRALLVSTGAEAVENAVKIARGYTKRSGVLCFEHGFHGRTLLALSLTGKAVPYKAGFGPFPSEIHRLPFPYAYRGQGVSGSIEGALKTLVAPQDLAAIIIEPVLGEGGFLVPPAPFLQELRDLATRHGIVLIVDEVQTGFGRTGKMFACDRFGIEPDLITLAKSMSAGMPLAAVVGRAPIMDAIPPGGVGGTFAGNPLSCVAAIQAMKAIEQIVERSDAERLGSRLRARLDRLGAEVPLVGDVRGVGAMQAIELVKNRGSKEPATAETAEIVRIARERGLLLFPAGTYGNVIRFLMPLTTSLDVLDEGLDVFEAVLRQVAGATPNGAR
jgi:4-aminobutyrate aminotransferase / (S)-3-amino-2-methylpropionate transaminase / 5-aminovalerate transaminase